MRAIFPGSFDPLTNGHLDLIERVKTFTDELLVAHMINPDKQGLFIPQQRVSMLRECLKDFDGVEVISFTGLLADLARQFDVRLIVRGVRNCADFDLECAMAGTNARLLPGLETVLLPAAGAMKDVSSSLVRQIAAFHGDVSAFVPPNVAEALRARFSDKPEK